MDVDIVNQIFHRILEETQKSGLPSGSTISHTTVASSSSSASVSAPTNSSTSVIPTPQFTKTNTVFGNSNNNVDSNTPYSAYFQSLLMFTAQVQEKGRQVEQSSQQSQPQSSPILQSPSERIATQQPLQTRVPSDCSLFRDSIEENALSSAPLNPKSGSSLGSLTSGVGTFNPLTVDLFTYRNEACSQPSQRTSSSSSSSSPILSVSSHPLTMSSTPSTPIESLPGRMQQVATNLLIQSPAEMQARFEVQARMEAQSQAINDFLRSPKSQCVRPVGTPEESDALRNSVTVGELLVPSNDKEGWCRNKKYIEIVKKGYRCTVCNKVYGRYNSVSYHVTIYHRNPPIKCEEDGCQFTTREARYIHFHKYYRHQIPLPESIDLASRKCPLLRCKHVSKSPAMLEKHMQRHVIDCLRDGVYECAECGDAGRVGGGLGSIFRTAVYDEMSNHLRNVHAGSIRHGTAKMLGLLKGSGDATDAAMEYLRDDDIVKSAESPANIENETVRNSPGSKARNSKSPPQYACAQCVYSPAKTPLIDAKNMTPWSEPVLYDLTNSINFQQQQQKQYRDQLRRLQELQLLQAHAQAQCKSSQFNLGNLLAEMHANGASGSLGGALGTAAGFLGTPYILEKSFASSPPLPESAALSALVALSAGAAGGLNTGVLPAQFQQTVPLPNTFLQAAFEQLLGAQKALFASTAN